MGKYLDWGDTVRGDKGLLNLKKGMFLKNEDCVYHMILEDYIIYYEDDNGEFGYSKLLKLEYGKLKWKEVTREELKTQLEIRKTDLYKAVYGTI